MIVCQECARPWGVALPKSYDEVTIAVGKAELASAYREWCIDVWEIDVSDKVPCPELTPPEPDTTEIVYVRESDYAFFDNIGIEVWGGEPPCWLEVDHVGAPEWWTKSRKRTALRWSCCDLDDPRSTDLADEIEAQEVARGR